MGLFGRTAGMMEPEGVFESAIVKCLKLAVVDTRYAKERWGAGDGLRRATLHWRCQAALRKGKAGVLGP